VIRKQLAILLNSSEASRAEQEMRHNLMLANKQSENLTAEEAEELRKKRDREKKHRKKQESRFGGKCLRDSSAKLTSPMTHLFYTMP
jgi:hypothetical protein